MKNVLITGAGRGIGLALTKEFLKNGYHVIGTYRDEKSASELLHLPQVTGVKIDVTDEKSFSSLKEELKKAKVIDVLVNNSGVIGDKSKSLLDININKVAEVLNVNTLGPMRICQQVIPFMIKGGTVAQITSLMGSIADNMSGGYYDYRMSKAALNMFNASLTKEFSHLKCLVLHPGWVQTDMGGAGANVTAEDCAQGLFQVMTDEKRQSGHFYDFRGKELPW